MSSSDPSGNDTIPRRMLRQGRPTNNHFEPDETLYIRFNAAYLNPVMAEEMGLDVFINYKTDQSTNRSFPDGEAGDVLLPVYHDWGIAAFIVSDIPAPHKTESGKEFAFGIRHDPLEDNYYHSVMEVVHSGDPSPLTLKNANKQVRSYLRIELSKKTRVIKTLPPQ